VYACMRVCEYVCMRMCVYVRERVRCSADTCTSACMRRVPRNEESTLVEARDLRESSARLEWRESSCKGSGEGGGEKEGIITPSKKGVFVLGFGLFAVVALSRMLRSVGMTMTCAVSSETVR